jgi:hypothetical protein
MNGYLLIIKDYDFDKMDLQNGKNGIISFIKLAKTKGRVGRWCKRGSGMVRG